MRTRDFAAKHIVFSKTSPITGPFRLELYPFLGKPMDTADDITCRRMLVLKASSCMGTVLGQIINAKRIAFDVGDQLMICQTDDHADKWTKTRGKEWLESIPDVMMLLKQDKYAQTLALWLFRHKFLSVSGPSIANAQSDQVRFVQTDEAHLESYPQGRLLEFEKRMGARWDSQATHISTCPDEGRELAEFFLKSSQEEWCWRCPKCNELIWPLWEDRAKARYNGETIFKWVDNGSESAMLNSIFAVCPHCSHVSLDNPRDRYALVKDGDYIVENPSAPKDFRGFRWSTWSAAHWIEWRVFLAEHLAAMEAARKFSDLKPHEDFVKKRECMLYRPELPNIGEGKGTTNYKLGDVWHVEDSIRILTADNQAGKRDEGAHIWGLVTEWDKQGNSRRLAYRKLLTWTDLRQLQIEFNIPDYCLADPTKNLPGRDSRVCVDAGHDARTVQKQCSLYGWYSTRGSDATEFLHRIVSGRGTQNEKVFMVPHPYSQPERRNGNIGQAQPKENKRVAGTVLPPGWCLELTMANPTLYGYLHALQSGATGRYFGIATDMPEEYTQGFPAFIPVVEKNKKTNVETVIWKKVKQFEHPHDCEVQALMMAIRLGYFPLATQTQTEEKAA